VKSASISSYSAPGTSVTYSYKVTNTGNVTLTAVKVTDPMVGLSAISCPATSLAVAVSETCTASYTTTQADMDAGSISNTGSATGTPPTGPNVTDSSSLTIPAVQSPALTVVKESKESGFDAAGTTLDFTFLVTNTGNVTLTGITVNDPLADLSTPFCPTTTLAPAANVTCTADYVTTQADVDRGSVVNSATATGDPPTGPPPTSPPSSVTVPAVQSPSLTVTKSAQQTSFSTAGQMLDFSFLVTNTGNVTLTDITVNDELAGTSTPSCPSTTLTPGNSVTCTATYVTTQANVDAGSVANTATVTGDPPSGPPTTSPPSTVTVPAVQSSSLSVTKTAQQSNFTAAGETLDFSFLVTNTGNVTLTDITVNDELAGTTTPSCPSTTLTPGDSVTCTATYVTTQANVDAGSVSNTATVTGDPPSGPPTTSPPSTVTVPAVQEPAVTILKSADIETFSAANTPVTYSYKVTNTGNVTLTAVKVTDPMVGLSSVSCPSGSLAVGANETCTASYTTTQADVDAGSIVNTGTVTAKSPTGADVTDSSTLTIPASQTPSLSVVKTARQANFDAPGVTLDFSFLATNTGNVTFTGIVVNDDLAGTSTPSCPDTTLAPGASETCTATYVTTQADVDAGSITNSATVTGDPPSGPPVTSPPSTVTVPAVQTASITLLKSSTAKQYTQVGQVLPYSYVVTNTGNTTLSGVSITDDKIPTNDITCPTSPLLPGHSLTCSANYVVTQADLTKGSITNTGLARARGVDGTAVSSNTSLATIVVPTPVLSIVKTVDATNAAPGDTLTYTITVTNSGQLPYGSGGTADATFTDSLSGVTGDGTFVSGSLVASAGTATYTVGSGITWSGPLAVSAVATVTYRVVVDNPDTGPHSLTNTVVSTSDGSTCPQGSTDTSCSTTTPISDVSVVKQICTSSSATECGSGGDGPWASSATIGFGGTAFWRITVTNTGQVPLSGVTISDSGVPSCGTAAGTFNLAVGAVVSVYCQQSSLQTGYTNVASASYPAPTGAPVGGVTVTSTESEATVVVTPEASPAPIAPVAPAVTG